MNQPYVMLMHAYMHAWVMREVFKVQMYKSNVHTLLLRILNII